VHQQVESLLVLQKSRDVVEQNSRLGVVRHFADQLLQIVHSNVSSWFDDFDSLRSSAFLDEKAVAVSWIRSRVLFADFTDSGKTGPAFEHAAQFRLLLRSAHGKHFDTAVAQISHIAADSQVVGGGLREIAIPHPLNHS